MLLQSRLFQFAIKAVFVLIVIYLLWPFVAPAYDSLLIGASNKLSPWEISLVDGNRIVLYRYGRTGMGGIDSSWLHFGLVLVMALIAAMPGLRLWRRIKFIGIALAAMFAIHIGTIVLLAGEEFTGNDLLAVLLLPIGGSLFPALVWGALCLKHLPQALPPAPGSARKRKKQRRG